MNRSFKAKCLSILFVLQTVLIPASVFVSSSMNAMNASQFLDTGKETGQKLSEAGWGRFFVSCGGLLKDCGTLGWNIGAYLYSLGGHAANAVDYGRSAVQYAGEHPKTTLAFIGLSGLLYWQKNRIKRWLTGRRSRPRGTSQGNSVYVQNNSTYHQ